MKQQCRAHGFTLLELLVTLSIVGVVMAAVLACFEGGFRVYARIRDFGTREAEVYLAGEFLERDLAYVIPSAPYLFDARSLSFSRGPLPASPALQLQFRAPVDGGLLQWVGELGTPPAGVAGRGWVSLLDDSLDVRFAYAAPGQTDVWLSAWEGQTNLPTAVRMLVRGVDAEVELITRTIVLPYAVADEEQGR